MLAVAGKGLRGKHFPLQVTKCEASEAFWYNLLYHLAMAKASVTATIFNA